MDFVQATVRLLDSAGNAISNYATGFAGGGINIDFTTPLDTTGLWAVTQNGSNNILQVQGTRAQVNAALAGLSVTFANDANLMYKVQVITDDRMRDTSGALSITGSDANGGELNQGTAAGAAPSAIPTLVYDWATAAVVPANNGNITAANVDIRASLINETATFTGPGAQTVNEDVRTQIPGTFDVADPESLVFGTPVTVTLTVPSGHGTLGIGAVGAAASLTPSGGQAVTISGDNTLSITLTGRAADIKALLNARNYADTAADVNGGLFYSAPANGNHDYNGVSADDVTLTLSLNDSGSRFGNDVGAGSVAANPSDIIIPVTITPINDAPTMAFTNTPVSISGITAVSGFVISDVDNTDGGVLNITPGETDFMQATIRLLPAASTTPLPASGDAGGIDHANVVFSSSTLGTATVDATYTGNSSALVIRGTVAEVNGYLSDLRVALSGNFLNNNITYRIEVVADDRLRDAAGILDGSNAANGGLNTNGSTGTANVPATALDPYTATPVLAYNVISKMRTILGSNVNEAPSFVLLDNTPTFTENGAAVVLDANASLSDPELISYNNWGFSVLTLSRNGGANSDDVFGVTGSGSTGINFSGANIRNGATTVGTYTNAAGTLAITFNASATNAIVNSVLQAITYSNSNNNPPLSITISYVINDGDTDADRSGNGQGTGGALTGSGSITIGIIPTNDNPTLTGLTAKGYTEDSAAVVIGTGALPGDFDLARFAVNAGNWGNAKLTISRNGGATAEDSFSASGTLSVLTQGNTLTDGATTIGTITSNSGGTFTIIFAEDATTAQIQAAIRQIAYSNSRQTLAAAATANVTLNWLLEDCDTDADRATNPQGVGGNKTVTLGQTITLTGVNDAPVLADTALTISQVEDAALPSGAAVGVLVSTLTGGQSDVDSVNPQGIAITAADNTLGTWYYSTTIGTTNTWTVLPAVADNDALLLRSAATDKLYFKPTANINGTVAAGLTIRAWDQKTGAPGTKVDTSGANNGITTAFSTATDTVQLTVTAVNDAPTRTDATADTLLAVNEDIPGGVGINPPGDTVFNLFNPKFSDTTDQVAGGSSANTMAGIAITSDGEAAGTNGRWQYSTDQNTWTNLPAVTTTTALLLKTTDYLRFVPAANYNGTPGALTARLIDTSGAAITSGTTADVSNDTTKSGTTTRFSNSPNTVTLTTSITAVNDAPTVDLNGAGGGFDNAVTWTEGSNAASAAVKISTSGTLSDVDNNNLTQMLITVGSLQDGNSEVLTVGGQAFQLNTVCNNVPAGTFNVSYDNVTHIFTIVPGGAIDTKANFQTLLQGITYNNDSTDNPTANPVRTFDVKVTDAGLNDTTTLSGQLDSNLPRTTLTVTPANDQPRLTNLNAMSFHENLLQAAPDWLDQSITLSDNDSPTYSGGTITISGLVAADIVSLPSAPAAALGNVQWTGINGGNVQYHDGGSWITVGTATGGNAANYVITLNGSATAAITQRIIENLTFKNSSDAPVTSRTLTYTVNDGGAGGSTLGATLGVSIVRDNDTPVMTSTLRGGTYAEQNATALQFVGGTINVSDPDLPANFFTGGVGSLTVNLDTYVAGDTLSVFNQGTGAGQIGVSGNIISYANNNFATTSGTGNGNDLVITFNSVFATPTAVQALLAQLRYSNTTSNDPTVNGTDPSRDVTVTLNDGANTKDAGANVAGALTTSLTGTITITPANDKPTLTGAASTPSYTENGSAVVVDGTITVGDVDDTQIASATASITSNLTAGDTLNFTNQNGITGNYAGGVLTLTGSASLADYTTALKSITFSSTSDDPTVNATKTTRTIEWAVTDANSDGAGTQTSVIRSTTLTVIPAQDAPVLAGAGQTLLYTENGAAAVIDATINIASDLDDTQISGATVTISANYTAGDTLAFSTQNGISIASNAGGVLTLTGTATLANYTTALQSVQYSSTSPDPTAISTGRTVTWQVTDANSDLAGAAVSNTKTSTITITPAETTLRSPTRMLLPLSGTPH